jgi:hypothetical protein
MAVTLKETLADLEALGNERITEEPGAGKLHAGICAGGASASLPRLRGSPAGGGEDNFDVDPGTGKHAHQGIDAKKINPSANEVADPRLRDTEQLRSFSLGKLAFLNELTYLNHEGGTKPKVFSFLVAKAEIGEHIPA